MERLALVSVSKVDRLDLVT